MRHGSRVLRRIEALTAGTRIRYGSGTCPDRTLDKADLLFITFLL